jgi:hypothetical protein
MAQENLDLNVNVKTAGAESSIGSLKKQLREAANEVVALSDKFGATSAEAVKAAQKAAELRDRIGDAKSLTDAFNPDAKFKALTASLSGVAGGFGAVQGAMALFGAETENVQKTLLKVQSAMAISQGLQSIGESVDSFKQLGAVIRTQVVTAFSTLRGAIIATGLGALAVGLGLLIANFDKVKEAIVNMFPSLVEFASKLKNIVQGFTDFIGLTSQAARDTEALTNKTKDYIKELDNQIKKLEAQGGQEEEIYNKKKERIENQLKLIKGSNAEELQSIKDLKTDIEVLDIQEANRIKKKNEDIAKENEAARLKEQERNLASIKANEDFDTQLQQRLMQLDEEKATKKRELDFQNIQNQINDYDYLNQLKDDDFEDDQQRLANKEALIAEQKLIELSNLNLSEKERIDIISKYAKQEQDIDKAITDSKKAQKQAQVQETIKLMGQLTDFVGKDTVAGKALGIATATINTYQGASEALKQKSTLPSPFDVIAKVANVATIIATGIKTVKSIASVQLPKGGGGAAMPSMANIAPIMPQLPSAQITQLNQQTINDIGNQAVRAYVVESDVTSSQERITAIRQRARFS